MQDELDRENLTVANYWEANYNCSGIEKEETIPVATEMTNGR